MLVDKGTIREELGTIPAIDVHTHFETYTETFGYSMPRFFYVTSYLSCYGIFLDQNDIALLNDPDGDQKEQYFAMLRQAKKLSHTETAKLLEREINACGYPMTPDSYEGLTQWYASRTKEQIQAAAPMVKAYICNSAGHPLYGGLPGLEDFLKGKRIPDERMKRTLTISTLYCLHDLSEVRQLEQIAQLPITNLKDWEMACEKIIREFQKLGIVAFKDVYLYFRPKEIDFPSKWVAMRDMDQFLKGNPPTKELLDYMMFRAYEIAEGTGLPMQVHTGAVIDSAETAFWLSDYMKLIQSFPKMQFDLLHMNHPMLEPYESVLRSCPNAWGDATWVFTVDSEYVIRYLDWVLDAFIPEKTILFGSDRHCAGMPVAESLHSLQNLLADFFEKRIQNGKLSYSSAIELARMWLGENPANLFALQGELK